MNGCRCCIDKGRCGKWLQEHDAAMRAEGAKQERERVLDEYNLSMKIQIPHGMNPNGIESYIKDYIFIKGWKEPFESNYIHVENFIFRATPPTEPVPTNCLAIGEDCVRRSKINDARKRRNESLRQQEHP